MSKKYKVFRFCVILLFVAFLTLYFSQITGYYEYQNYQKMTMTEEAIKQFEQDIKDGKAVDVKDYVVNGTNDYKNRFSNTGTKISSGISGVVKTGVIKLFSAVAGYMKE